MTVAMFGRYQIQSQLGRGAMGTVHLALDPAIERTVAIKTLNPEVPDENMEETKEHFLREAKSAGRLNHPNVVTVYDVGEAAGVAYIAMEFLEGKSLREMLDANQPLPVHTISDIISQIADALDYAQRFGIVHRDVKPANIMLSPGGLAKLTDFGVAHMPASTMTQVGMVVGSPKYLSPEQVRGLPVDGRADIFSLGVVLFELLTGKTPFESPGLNVYSLMQRICTEPAPRVSGLKPGLPPALDAIVARALAKLPEERYQRAGDLANDLRNHKRSAPVEMERTTIIEPARALESTIVLPRGEPPASDGTDPEEMAKLLQDLEAFSHNLEREQRRLAEEARAPLQERADGNAGDVPQPAADARADKARSPLSGLLQSSAVTRKPLPPKPGKPALEAMLALDARLRQVFKHLAEFVLEFNAARPVYGGTLELPYVGKLPEMTLGDGFADYRTTKIGDRQVLDYIVLTYRVRSDTTARVTLNREEAAIVKVHLTRSDMRFEEQNVEHALHRVPRASLAIRCNLAASARLRADYDALAVEVTCQNVGSVGPSRYRMSADRFDNDAVGEFGKLLLGLQSRFREFKLPD